MGALVRQVAALSMLWAVCELLLPDGRQQMVRMTVSVLVMTALLSTAGEWLINAPEGVPALAQQVMQVSRTHYRQTALRAAANQTSAYCERFCTRAGYAAQADVFFRFDGGVERIELRLQPRFPLKTPEETARLLCEELGLDFGCVQLSVLEAEE